MDSHQNSSIVHVGDYEYNTRDLIGHGAFAVVFKGRHRKVNITFHIQLYLKIEINHYTYKQRNHVQSVSKCDLNAKY